MDTVIIFIAIILVASILQTSTGFGFSILATPFLLMIFEAKEAIQINLVLSLIISCSLIYKIRNDIDYSVLKRFVIGSVAGLPVGIIVFLLSDMNKLKFGISIIILMLTFLLIFKVRIRQTKGRDLSAGSLSGMLTTSIGMPGPPLLLYFSGIDSKKEKLRATTLAFYLFIYFFSLLMQIIFAGTNKTIWISSGYALPFVIIGLYFGQLLFVKINQRLFRIFTYIILLFTGCYLLIESLK
ncbi:sulfite exporter TauE/SafE family protein [Lederbergia wuyishanensis]|uniref:Probable membrane transporter protein n=1 Tax=Lederbergia wuyishanensis TaxID=1347903 RepID=A0ABU0D8B0_9BACI|nr:sulfite exporter TauE/SafE family protein [Lederbergia wuyishanensis]MCJ8009245.1 sulfite exporter TauE/SafE family protein [Lederbergia wuyishanensis]MDQ0344622.1 putative membrane protein YfcA [Lederbergia wuyishanensis]